MNPTNLAGLENAIAHWSPIHSQRFGIKANAFWVGTPVPDATLPRGIGADVMAGQMDRRSLYFTTSSRKPGANHPVYVVTDLNGAILVAVWGNATATFSELIESLPEKRRLAIYRGIIRLTDPHNVIYSDS